MLKNEFLYRNKIIKIPLSNWWWNYPTNNYISMWIMCLYKKKKTEFNTTKWKF